MADVFLYPSFVEAFPVPITESLACGAPIITSDQNGLREIAGDAARYVDPRDVSSVVAALGEVLGDDAPRQEMSRRSLEQSKRYTWERCTAQTLQAIKDAYES